MILCVCVGGGDFMDKKKLEQNCAIGADHQDRDEAQGKCFPRVVLDPTVIKNSPKPQKQQQKRRKRKIAACFGSIATDHSPCEGGSRTIHTTNKNDDTNTHATVFN